MSWTEVPYGKCVLFTEERGSFRIWIEVTDSKVRMKVKVFTSDRDVDGVHLMSFIKKEAWHAYRKSQLLT